VANRVWERGKDRAGRTVGWVGYLPGVKEVLWSEWYGIVYHLTDVDTQLSKFVVRLASVARQVHR